MLPHPPLPRPLKPSIFERTVRALLGADYVEPILPLEVDPGHFYRGTCSSYSVGMPHPGVCEPFEGFCFHLLESGQLHDFFGIPEFVKGKRFPSGYSVGATV